MLLHFPRIRSDSVCALNAQIFKSFVTKDDVDWGGFGPRASRATALGVA
jgi:hypothetical protein